MVGGAGAMLLTLGMARENPIMQADGMVVLKQNEKLCDDLTTLARQYEYVYKGLSYLVEGSVWSLVVGDILTLGVAIAVNHGIRMPFLSGSKEQVEEAQKKQIAVLQQEVQMLRMQQMAQEAA